MTIITRFAPSPTGYLHIGGARTALFNYLYAKHYKGKFLLRIEDTDKQRSTIEATQAIFSGLQWLGLEHDDEVIFQSARSERHIEIAQKLLANDKAYLCFTSQEEIELQRNQAMLNKQSFIFKSPWRDALPHTFPKNVKPVIRLKVPLEGMILIKDKLQGNIEVGYDHIDDMVLLRSDLTATYMLAVVVDDHDMNISHIIRGDDHLTNAARQLAIYKALEWESPQMVHIPLIHAEDGAKLSKRHGAPGVDDYKKMGYLPEALCNYLLRLGWSHGNEEIISKEKAINIFDLKGLVKSPAKFDISKLNFLNTQYLRFKSDEELMKILQEQINNISDISYNNIKRAIKEIKLRAHSISELVELSKIYNIDSPIEYDAQAKAIIEESDQNLINEVITELAILNVPIKDNIQKLFTSIAEKHTLKIGVLMAPIRALITGKLNSPSIFEIIEIIGVEISIKRLSKTI